MRGTPFVLSDAQQKRALRRKLDHVCPACGHGEAFSYFCSRCGRPTQVADVRDHAEIGGCLLYGGHRP